MSEATHEQEAREAGRQAGIAAGSWITDGNTSEDDYRHILEGYEDGDPEVMDLCPAPLSGEWAGDSIPELSDRFGIDLEDEDVATAFEEGYACGFWAEVLRACRFHIDADIDLDDPIHATGRRIASEWHGGQTSGLCALATSGAINADAIDETASELRVAQSGPHASSDTDRAELSILLGYLTEHGPRSTVPGWHRVRF